MKRNDSPLQWTKDAGDFDFLVESLSQFISDKAESMYKPLKAETALAEQAKREAEEDSKTIWFEADK